MAELDSSKIMYRAKAPVSLGSYTEKERNALLAMAAERAPDPSIFEEEGMQPFLFRVQASNQNVDSYYTKMNESSLANYAADADQGVQFQVGHSYSDVGFGRSIQGKVTGSKGARLFYADFYAIPGLRTSGMSSDEFILGARAGVYSDVSIGFMPGAMICNICNNDFMKKWELDWDSPERCTHWPGITYETDRGKKIQCILDVQNARLNEVSVVYDGATPGAGIVALDMARMVDARGELTDVDRNALENFYRVRIATDAPIFRVPEDFAMAGRKPAGTDDSQVVTNDENNAAVTDDTTAASVREKTVITLGQKNPDEGSSTPMGRLQAKYDEAGIRLSDDPHESIELLADALIEAHGRIATMEGDSTKLEREAKDGRDFREELLKDLDAAVVRAFGTDGAEARQVVQRKAADAMSIAEVRAHITDLNGIGDSRFQPGRQSRDRDEEETEEKPRRRSSAQDW